MHCRICDVETEDVSKDGCCYICVEASFVNLTDLEAELELEHDISDGILLGILPLVIHNEDSYD